MPEYNGCKRWLVIPGFGTLQPSEIAKFAVVLVFSHIIALNHDRMKDFSVGVLLCAGAGGGGGPDAAGAAPVRHRPHPWHRRGADVRRWYGAAVVFAGGRGRRRGHRCGGGRHARPRPLRRRPAPLLARPFADPLGDGHQTIQSLYAIGSGGATGLGLGESRQKHLFVPEPQNDFIFSIVCEELGFVGACAVVGLFVLLLCRGITIAAHAPDRFGALLVVGFVVQVPCRRC